MRRRSCRVHRAGKTRCAMGAGGAGDGDAGSAVGAGDGSDTGRQRCGGVARRSRGRHRPLGRLQRQQQREGAALAGHAVQAQAAAHAGRQLQRDRQPQPRAAVMARDAAIGLAECFEDQLLLAFRHADARIADGAGQHGRAARHARRHRQPQRHLAPGRKLDGVAQQVAQHLRRVLQVQPQQGRHGPIAGHGQAQTLLRGGRAEQIVERRQELGRRAILVVAIDLARLHLGQVEDVVDQVEQVLAGRVDGAGVLRLLRRQVAGPVVAQQARQDQHAVERGAQLMRHIGQELALVGADALQLLGLVPDFAAGPLHFRVLGADLLALAFEQLGTFLQLLVALLEFLLLHAQFLGLALRLAQQRARALARQAHVKADGHAFAHQFQPCQFGLAEGPERACLQRAHHVGAMQQRQQHHAGRRRPPQRGGDGEVAGRHLLEHDGAPFQHGLAQHPFTQRQRRARPGRRRQAVAGHGTQLLPALVVQVEGAGAGADALAQVGQHAVGQHGRLQLAAHAQVQFILAQHHPVALLALAAAVAQGVQHLQEGLVQRALHLPHAHDRAQQLAHFVVRHRRQLDGWQRRHRQPPFQVAAGDGAGRLDLVAGAGRQHAGRVQRLAQRPGHRADDDVAQGHGQYAQQQHGAYQHELRLALAGHPRGQHLLQRVQPRLGQPVLGVDGVAVLAVVGRRGVAWPGRQHDLLARQPQRLLALGAADAQQVGQPGAQAAVVGQGDGQRVVDGVVVVVGAVGARRDHDALVHAGRAPHQHAAAGPAQLAQRLAQHGRAHQQGVDQEIGIRFRVQPQAGMVDHVLVEAEQLVDQGAVAGKAVGRRQRALGILGRQRAPLLEDAEPGGADVALIEPLDVAFHLGESLVGLAQLGHGRRPGRGVAAERHGSQAPVLLHQLHHGQQGARRGDAVQFLFGHGDGLVGLVEEQGGGNGHRHAAQQRQQQEFLPQHQAAQKRCQQDHSSNVRPNPRRAAPSPAVPAATTARR